VTIIRSPSELRAEGRKVCLAIGMFDGVHLGHQQVIRQTIQDARQLHGFAVAVTFDKHPSSVVAPHRAPLLIYSLCQKLDSISSLGVDAILLLEFNQEFSKQSGESFVSWLAEGFQPLSSISVGTNFSFGHKRSGNVDLLKRLGPKFNFSVNDLSAVAVGGRVVSSTRIREHVALGQLKEASECLGRKYSLSSTVVRGDQLGRQLGFPTANLDIARLTTPPSGVYAVKAIFDGRSMRGVANIGTRPTVSDGTPAKRLEVHIFDFEGDLYGKDLEVCFLQKLREEQKFPSIDALKAQIRIDVDLARVVLT
jgi:riboflavin kinase / FMN adenylyltransferase